MGQSSENFIFPNEFVTDLDKLKSELPEHSAFYSSLSNRTSPKKNTIL